MRQPRNISFLSVGLFVVALGFGVASDALAKPFVRRPLPVQSGRLFDLGVTDINDDNRYEVFTANHKYLGSLLTPTAGGGWSDRLGSLGLAPTPAYPGFEDLLHPPNPSSPGLYIYGSSRALGADGETHSDSRLDVEAVDVGSIPLLPETAKGTITVLSPHVQVTHRQGAKVTITRDNTTTPGRTVVSFEVAEAAHLEFIVRKIDLPPIMVDIGQPPLVARTYVGARKVPAASPQFTLYLRDRHGWAWGDFNDDGYRDAFIARGGLGGEIRDYKGFVDDELMLGQPNGRFVESYAGSGLNKAGCRTRRTQSGDFDGDGNLDIFTYCKASSPKLYLGNGAGHFTPVSRRLRRAGVRGTGYRWVDLDGDLVPELITVEAGRVRVYRHRGRSWVRTQSLIAQNRTKLIESLSYGDFDADGDPDLFVAVHSGNTVLVNRDGRLFARRPAHFGLPEASIVGSFVDANNDGRVDLHALPQGLYLQKRNGHFRPSRLAAAPPSARFGLTSWFDYDNDGDRDIAEALKLKRGVKVKTALYENRMHGGHWLSVEVKGPAGNAEGVGARVSVFAGSRRRVAWVGESDGSRFSQGDFRVHFGLGKKVKRIRGIRVDWPGGGHTSVGPRAADRLVEVVAP